jgi:hypothetical protein
MGTSTSCIPSAWEHVGYCGWTTSWTSWCDTSNFNCLLRPLVTTLDIFHKSLINKKIGQHVVKENIKTQHVNPKKFVITTCIKKKVWTQKIIL